MTTTHSLVAEGVPSPPNGTLREGAPLRTFNWESKTPKPVVVQMYCNITGSGATTKLRSQPSNFAVGDADFSGYVRIDYGLGASRKRIELDVSHQTLQLPPITYLSVGVRRFNQSGVPIGLPVDFGVAAGEGILGGDALLPEASHLLANPGVATYSLTTPAGARYWQMGFTNQNVPRDIVVSGRRVYVDFNVPSAFPSHPLWIATETAESLTFSGVDAAATFVNVTHFVQP